MSYILEQRLTDAGMKTSPFYNEKSHNSFCDGKNNLPNCTCYSMGRAMENQYAITGKVDKDLIFGNRTQLGNAKTWYKDVNSSLKRGSTPKLGAIVVFDGNAGHVGNVEEVYSDNSFLMSYSEKGGVYFATTKLNVKVGYSVPEKGWGALLGFIYLPWDLELKKDELKFKVGDKVVINGELYKSSNASEASGKVSNKVTEITRVAEGAAHPYNTTGDLGWMDEADIKKYSSSSSSSIKEGDKVKVKKAINYDTGKSFALYYKEYTVMELKGNRAVIGVNGVVTAPIDKKNLEKA